MFDGEEDQALTREMKREDRWRLKKEKGVWREGGTEFDIEKEKGRLIEVKNNGERNEE